MNFEELVNERHAVRKFADKKIEPEKLLKVLEIGNKAPTAKNLQPYKIFVIQSEENIKKLSAIFRCMYGANTVLLFCADKDQQWVNPYDSNITAGQQDVAIVATHIMLEAKELGLDTCWCCAFNNHEVEEVFGLPENLYSVLLMPIGYAAEDSIVNPNHTKKKPLTETVEFI